jgi:predicted kinase
LTTRPYSWSAFARALGRALHAPVLSVDPIEAALLRAGIDRAQPTGLAAYVVADALAERQLDLGLSSIVDAANYVEPGRRMWRDLAARRGVPLRWIELFCSDEAAHRARLEARSVYLDTAAPVEEFVARALAYLLPCLYGDGA